MCRNFIGGIHLGHGPAGPPATSAHYDGGHAAARRAWRRGRTAGFGNCVDKRAGLASRRPPVELVTGRGVGYVIPVCFGRLPLPGYRRPGRHQRYPDQPPRVGPDTVDVLSLPDRGCPRSLKMAKMAPKKRSAGPRRPPSKAPSGGLPRPERADSVPAGRGRGRRGPEPAAGAQTPLMPPGKSRVGRLLSPGHAWMLRQMDTMASSRFCISSVTDRTQYANRPLMAEKHASMLDLVL